jgi:hypothetical protein
MRRIYYFLLIPVILLIGIVVGLHFTGYLLNDQKIIPPSSQIEWKDLKEVSFGDNTNESNSTFYHLPVILNLTEKMKDIPGIEYIKYKVFVSNDSIQQIINYYTDILEKEGYSYHDEYSGMKTYEYSEIYYYTFIKGLNGVVLYLSQYDQHTWICYSTSDIIHYQQIFNYMIAHNIIS